MSDVAGAWRRYVELVTAKDLPVPGRITSTDHVEGVRAALGSAAACDDLVAYFAIINKLAKNAGSRVFPDLVALDLAAAVGEHQNLLEFAEREADGEDPELLYSARWFPLGSGKPTTFVDIDSGAVFDQWWDEVEPRRVANDIAGWIDSQAALLSDAKLLERFRGAFEVGRPRRLATFAFRPHQMWCKRFAVTPMMHDCSRIIIRRFADGGGPASLGLETVQAQLVADALFDAGVDRSVIEFQIDDPDERGSQGGSQVWVDGVLDE